MPFFQIPIKYVVKIYPSGEKSMQFFYWLIFLMAIGIAIFAVQNSSAPPVIIKFLIWKFETSLVYTILGSILSGILLSLLLWIPKVVRTSFQKGKQPSGTPLGGPP
jgi:uncharacterized integral membrane protein